ncbi:MAG: glycosyltransferase family 2 protein [Cyclobacteriaceae bacterium]|nr:glycosyltransferase family 2 protein [Cyclobacteriaceae bacterium]
MVIAEFFLFISIFIIFYTYAGYGLIILIINKLFNRSKVKVEYENSIDFPTLTLLVAAYNEEDYIEEKILNSLSLNYPKELYKIVFITDGSTDNTNQIIERYDDVVLLYKKERMGKIAATKRAMKYINTEIVVYSDANTTINQDALLHIVKHYKDPKVGGVACEKKVRVLEADNASGAGEGFYWKYESFLKKQDSIFYSVVGAAGELFSIRTELFEEIPSDSIIEDFYMTMKIAENGHVIRYEPNAYAMEDPSFSISEEYKRKTRISAGGIQSIIRLNKLLLPFKNPRLSFLYVSHRVLRWSLTPLLLLITFVLSVILALKGSLVGEVLTLAQIVFYLLAFIGFLLRNQKVKAKLFYIPFYFVFMNYAVYVGAFRYFSGRQSVVWEKSKRA